MAQGLNQYTGAPVRWDYISAHVKGESTSYVTVEGEWGVSALIRSNPTWSSPGAGIITLPISNDEGDPMVGWEVPEDWRGDARYGAIIPKMVLQHVVAIGDNATTNNPLGWLSFDGAFMNGVGDNYTGFGERTMTTRFGLPSATPTPFAFVRKNGLLAFSLLARLPTATRCTSTTSTTTNTGSGSGDVLSSPTGVLATMDTGGSGDVGVLVYNSPDCSDGSINPTVTPVITLSSLPWAPGTPDAVAVPYLLNDDPSISTYAAWQKAGSPAIPSGEVLQELWRVGAAGGAAASPPIPVTLTPCGGGGGGVGSSPNTSCLTLPPPTSSSPDLPSPGVVMWHVAVKGGAAPEGPPPPPTLLPYVKPPQASLLPPGTAEVFLKWDCVQAPRTLYYYVIQVSSGGQGGPWTQANPPPFPKDTLCSFNHAATGTPPGTQLWYRVAGVDYWGVQGPFSNATLALPWPVYV